MVAWLAGQTVPGVAAAAPLFVRHGVTGRDLADLTHADLLSMGVLVLGVRKALLRAAAQLTAAVPVRSSEC